MYKKIKSALAVGLCFLFIGLSACAGEKVDVFGSLRLQDAAEQKVVTLPQTPRFEKLLDGNGKIITEYLDSQTISVIKKNYDDRVYIEYKGMPYFYNPVYISYDQILSNRYIAQNRKTAVLEDSFAKAKESGFKSVALYVNWKDFYDGTSYNFDFYKIYYILAEKYDLNVSIIWIGYSKTGYMPWQTDRTKYPSLNTEGTKLKVEVPDLSQDIYVNEACEAITQFCAWLNYIDYNRRTVSIQLEDEANTNYGKGVWLSQYVNYSNLLEKMADAVKNSPYKMVTTVGITFDDYYMYVDGFDGRQRLDTLLSKVSIDGLGAANLTTQKFSVGMFANDNKFCYISKLSPAEYGFFTTAMALLKQGYHFGVYELKSFDLAINCGLYRTHSNVWQLRDRQTLDRGILAKKYTLEASTADVIDFIRAINSVGEVFAYTSVLDIVILNPTASNNYIFSSAVGDISVNFNNTANPYFTYNSAGICLVDAYSNYYVFSFHGTSYLAVDYDGNVNVSDGKIIDGEWVSEVDAVTLEEHRFKLASGVVYKFTLD